MSSGGGSEGRHETGSPEETASLGAALAAALDPGTVVLLAGEVGAGKSTFIRGALRELGVRGAIPSPTFTIGRRYRAGGGRFASHLDLYRLESLEDEDPGLLEPYLGPETIAFVEWPEAGEAEFAGTVVRVRIEHAGADRRVVTVSPPRESG